MSKDNAPKDDAAKDDAKKTAAQDAADAKAKAQEEKKAAENKVEAGFYVAKGKCLTTKKGIKSDGDVITADCFNGGEKDLKNWLDKGFIVKV